MQVQSETWSTLRSTGCAPDRAINDLSVKACNRMSMYATSLRVSTPETATGPSRDENSQQFVPFPVFSRRPPPTDKRPRPRGRVFLRYPPPTPEDP